MQSTTTAPMQTALLLPQTTVNGSGQNLPATLSEDSEFREALQLQLARPMATAKLASSTEELDGSLALAQRLGQIQGFPFSPSLCDPAATAGVDPAAAEWLETPAGRETLALLTRLRILWQEAAARDVTPALSGTERMDPDLTDWPANQAGLAWFKTSPSESVPVDSDHPSSGSAGLSDTTEPRSPFDSIPSDLLAQLQSLLMAVADPGQRLRLDGAAVDSGDDGTVATTELTPSEFVTQLHSLLESAPETREAARAGAQATGQATATSPTPLERLGDLVRTAAAETRDVPSAGVTGTERETKAVAATAAMPAEFVMRLRSLLEKAPAAREPLERLSDVVRKDPETSARSPSEAPRAGVTHPTAPLAADLLARVQTLLEAAAELQNPPGTGVTGTEQETRAVAATAAMPAEFVSRLRTLLQTLPNAGEQATLGGMTSEQAGGSTDSTDSISADLVTRLRDLLRTTPAVPERTMSGAVSLGMAEGDVSSTEPTQQALAARLRTLLQAASGNEDGSIADRAGSELPDDDPGMSADSLSPVSLARLRAFQQGSEAAVRDLLAQHREEGASTGGRVSEDPGTVVLQGAGPDRGAAAPVRGAGQDATAAPSRSPVLDLAGLLQPGGERRLAEQVRWMSQSRLGTAELKLRPANLGSLDVRVTMEGERAHVQFLSASPIVREALETALPRLRDALAQDGLSLGQVAVSDHTAGGHREPFQDQTHETWVAQGAGSGHVEEDPIAKITERPGAAQSSRLDVFT